MGDISKASKLTRKVTPNQHVEPYRYLLSFLNGYLRDPNKAYDSGVFYDLNDAYYSVPMALEHQKYLKFVWWNQLYAFTCLPMDLLVV